MQRLPQVDKLLRDPGLEESLSRYKREVVLRVLRQLLAELRKNEQFPESPEIVDMLIRQLQDLESPSLAKLINGTGVVLNTNLGRAPLAGEHIEKLKEISSGYCNLEINLETGKRGKRSTKLKRLLNVLCGAEASLALNNNAACVVLAVNCFALGKEVVVSRGELVEIGGSFRLPDVIEAAGGILREVGSTNKTRISDFERAIGPRTGLVMRCHRSNFELRGFTEEVKIAELVALCKEKAIPFFEDLGSGVLMNLAELGLAGEPTVEESISASCDLVSFSGDKLLGGPQAGIISGKKEYIEMLSRHPLYRALRLDKLIISLLEQTLASYLLKETRSVLPALKLIAADRDQISSRIEHFIQKNSGRLKYISMQISECQSAIGGGSLPGKEKPSACIVLSCPWKAHLLAKELRQASTPVITITKEDETIIDFRTVLEEDENRLFEALIEVEKKLSEV